MIGDPVPKLRVPVQIWALAERRLEPGEKSVFHQRSGRPGLRSGRRLALCSRSKQRFARLLGQTDDLDLREEPVQAEPMPHGVDVPGLDID